LQEPLWPQSDIIGDIMLKFKAQGLA
jgi:hypothetical protein